ncbi:hypothetical protein [Paracoccus zhejiangensis]|uniref:Uncharacterized protein n=1 Tax=Paracoccus zhejiangensis TaxID=1077935 RepID=A0A2H5EXF9_9RHOB|nr:hypothetical protein [Paracoccus zhejiangensis]AUH63953.1 hypothetical protein CX676_07075 [Paracoccus zhejiangensis]
MARGRVMRVAGIALLGLLGILLAIAVAIMLLARMTFSAPEGPRACDDQQVALIRHQASAYFPQLATARVLRSNCPYGFPGGGQTQLLVMARDSIAGGIAFTAYEGPVEWGPEGQLADLPDLFPSADLGGHLIASIYPDGANLALHLLKRADGTGPVTLAMMWL